MSESPFEIAIKILEKGLKDLNELGDTNTLELEEQLKGMYYLIDKYKKNP